MLTRQEKDSLGVVEVPAGAMYGAQTARAVENYPISGMRAAGALIRAIGMVKRAAAEANGELEVVSEERTAAIAAAAQEVIDGKWDAEFVVDVFQAGAGVSFHMNANEVIANRANQLIAGDKVRGTNKATTEILSFAQNDDAGRGGDAEGGEERVPGAKARIDSAPVMPGLKSRPISETSYSAAREAVPLAKGGEPGVGGDTTATTEILRVAQNDDAKSGGIAQSDDAAGGGGLGAKKAGPQGLKPLPSNELHGTAEAVPLSKTGEVRGSESSGEAAERSEGQGGGTTTTTEILRVAQNDDVGRGDDAESVVGDSAVLEAEVEALGRYEWVHPNDHVNYGQSTNDVFPTAMRLGTLLALEGLYPVLAGLAGSFAAKAAEFDGVLKAGRTHMQDATPIRLGQEFAAYGVAIRKAKESIARAAEGLRELGLGGSAVGTGINTHPEYRALAIAKLAVISGQELVPASDMRWAMQSCGPMAEVSAALRGLALEVIRIANDLRLMASGPNTGFNEIALPSLQPGSSIMPGKINPVLAELAAMVGFQVVGNDAAVAMAVQAGQLELNVMMPTMAYSVLQSIAILTNMLRQLDTRCVRGITANQARCEFYAQSTVALATALNPYIGYAKAAEIVKESVATGRSVIEVAREKGVLSEAQIREILDVGKMTGA